MHALLTRSIARRLRSCAVVVPLVAAAAFLDGGHAQAVAVTVGGNDYDVSYFSGTYADNSSRFNSTDMPWWGDGSLAESLALAVGDKLGNLYYEYGPLFAFETRTSFNNSVVSYMKAYDWPNSSFTSSDFSETRPYAFVQQAQPVPGPLPVLGAAAAFGWSRRMRRHLKRGADAS